MGNLTARTLKNIEVSFDHSAFINAMARYRLADIEEVAIKLERGYKVAAGVAEFFRDFAIIQAAEHPDFDRGLGIASLAIRIEVAMGDVTPEELVEMGIDLAAASHEYDLAFR